jgi:hypothetical protein
MDVLSEAGTPWFATWETLYERAWWYLNHSVGLPPSISRGRPFHGNPRLRLWDDAMGFCHDREPTTLTVLRFSRKMAGVNL